MQSQPRQSTYDIVIIGGAIMGSSAAWYLSQAPEFDGRILVVEKDMSYQACATAHTNSCIRQQFSSKLNIEMSQYTASFISSLQAHMGDDPRVPDIDIHSFGYLYLSDNPAFSDTLKRDQTLQNSLGAATEILSPDDIAARYPFYDLTGIDCGSLNTLNEGYWDGSTVFEWMRRKAMENGVEYIENSVVGMTRSVSGNTIETVTLASGAVISCGTVLNATGPRAAQTARMAGIELPVEPRKRFTWVIKAETPLDRDLPLTIDPSGVHVRENGGGTYMVGGKSDQDHAVDPDDFDIDHSLWMDHIWPTLATRIPAFEAVKIQSEWAGHYDFNIIDQNAILGPHPELSNLIFMNGFSGHGLQHAPAMGRGISELILHGDFRTLDLSPFSFDRLLDGTASSERAII